MDPLEIKVVEIMPGTKGKLSRKRFIADDQFEKKMRDACTCLREIGMVTVLEITGMHRSCLRHAVLMLEGNDWYLEWIAPKAQRRERDMKAWVPPQDVLNVRAWLLKYSKKHPDTYWRWLKEIASRAGYPNISPMTYRAQRIVRLLKAGTDPREVMIMTGATEQTIFRYYAQASIKEKQQIMMKVRDQGKEQGSKPHQHLP